jgi:hypothetical protein
MPQSRSTCASEKSRRSKQHLRADPPDGISDEQFALADEREAAAEVDERDAVLAA